MSRTAQILEISEYYQEKVFSDQSIFGSKVADSLIAADIMTSGVITISYKGTIKDAVELFLEEKVTALIVVDHNQSPVGVFSETDLARFERERPNVVLDPNEQGQLETLNEHSGEGQHFHVETLANSALYEWMTPCIISVESSDSLMKICSTLASNHIHRVFVKEHDRLIGVISSMDIVSALAVVLDGN